MKPSQFLGCALVAGLALLATGTADARSHQSVSVDDGNLRLTASKHPDALVTPDGRLFIDGVEIPTTPVQRLALGELHVHVAEIGHLGQAIGEDASKIADEVKALVTARMGDLIAGRVDQATFKAEVEQATKARLAGPLDGLCSSVEALVDGSGRVIESGLVVFAPYAAEYRDAGRECRAGIASVQL